MEEARGEGSRQRHRRRHPLRRLDLSSCYLGPDCVRAVLHAVENDEHLLDVLLSNNQCDVSAMTAPPSKQMIMQLGCAVAVREAFNDSLRTRFPCIHERFPLCLHDEIMSYLSIPLCRIVVL